jgi:hypothetical protein
MYIIKTLYYDGSYDYYGEIDKIAHPVKLDAALFEKEAHIRFIKKFYFKFSAKRCIKKLKYLLRRCKYPPIFIIEEVQ